VTLGRGPHAVREVHRERLGDAAPKVRRAVDVIVGGMLERLARESHPVTSGRRISVALAERGSMRSQSMTGIALDGTPYRIRRREHRLDASSLDRIRRIEREPQDRQTVLRLARPRRLLVPTRVRLSASITATLDHCTRP